MAIKSNLIYFMIAQACYVFSQKTNFAAKHLSTQKQFYSFGIMAGLAMILGLQRYEPITFIYKE